MRQIFLLLLCLLQRSVSVTGQEDFLFEEEEAATVNLELQHGSGGGFKRELRRKQQCFAYTQYYNVFLPATFGGDQCEACSTCDRPSANLCPEQSCSTRDQIEQYCRDVARPRNGMFYRKSQSGKSSNGFGGDNEVCGDVCPATCFFSCVEYVSSCCPCDEATGNVVVVHFQASNQVFATNPFLGSINIYLNQNSPLVPTGEITTSVGTVTNNGLPVYGSLLGGAGSDGLPSWNLDVQGHYLEVPGGSFGRSLILWRSDDFSVGSSCSSEAKSVTIVGRSEGFSSFEPFSRVVIKAAGKWIASEAFSVFGFDEELSNLMWYEYDPYQSLNAAAGVGNLTQPIFTCVDFIGVFIAGRGNAPGNPPPVNPRIFIKEFSAFFNLF